MSSKINRLSLAGVAVVLLAGCTAATGVPSGMGHPADASAAAGKMPHDGSMRRGDMQLGDMDKSAMSMDGHDMASMEQDSMPMKNGDRGQDGHGPSDGMGAGQMMPGDEVASLPDARSHDHGATTDVAVDRIIEVSAVDVDFEPKSISVRAGETIRFVVTNNGAVDHEFVLGNGEAQVAHAEEMAAMGSNMDHSHLNAMVLRPGETKEVVWTFEAGQNVQFACHIPGHYEAGMWGTIEIDS